jgi:hypothetical protein
VGRRPKPARAKIAVPLRRPELAKEVQAGPNVGDRACSLGRLGFEPLILLDHVPALIAGGLEGADRRRYLCRSRTEAHIHAGTDALCVTDIALAYFAGETGFGVLEVDVGDPVSRGAGK